MSVPRLSAVLVCLASLSMPSLPAGDWPEWRGDGRRGVWSEDGILESFPDDGLEYTWRVPIGEGYAGPAVAGRRVFAFDFAREEGVRGTERALCLDERSGEVLWERRWSADYAGSEPSWASGPRATPTVEGRRVFFLGAAGRLVALDAKRGTPLWERDLTVDYGAPIPTWGFASPPLVHGKLLISLVGGDEAMVVAFDKRNGKEVWRALPGRGAAGYATPLLLEAGGKRQLIVWHPTAVHSLNPATGEVYWEQPQEVRMGMTVASPVVGSGRLFVSSFFDGSMMLGLGSEKPTAELLWKRGGKTEQPDDTRSLHSLITTPVMDGDHVYGIDSYGELRGLDAGSGERLWTSTELVGEQARWAAGLIVRHRDRFFVNTDRGDLVIARFTPEGYIEIDRTPLIKPTSAGGGRRELGAVHWSHPAYANGHIVVRNDREIVRASLRAPDPERR